MIRWLARVRRLGDVVLGINGRNLDFVYPANPRALFYEVDDKLVTKEILGRAGIPTPETLAVFERFRDVDRLRSLWPSLDRGFVVKPACASGGTGILVVHRGEGGRLLTPDRHGERTLDVEDVAEHVVQLLAGLEEPERLTERAFLEELLEAEETLGRLSHRGLPDIRVLTFRGRPVMGMLRLATRQSRGRANLHQGAIGVGVDLRDGITTHAVLGTRSIATHPDTALPLGGIRVPCWGEILDLAERAAAAVRLGYVGIDLCISRQRGPLVIEINARPGLNIQLANRVGLRERLGTAP